MKSLLPIKFPNSRTIGLSLWGLSIAVSMFAHDGMQHTHEDTVDDRLTPRSAATHVTGTLPPATRSETEPKSSVSGSIRDGFRYIQANGIPDHETGRFPNKGNPNVVSAQDYHFRIPLDPDPPKAPISKESDVYSDRGYIFGIAINGVPFEPATGLNWTPQGLRRGGGPGDWVYEAVGGAINFGIDAANAHVQRTGAYHYHGVPTPMIKEDQPTLIGYAADGYPIYGPLIYADPMDPSSRLITARSSWQLKTEARPGTPPGPGELPDGRFTADWEYVPGSGDLDRLNGRFGRTPEYPKGVYYYVVTETFPQIARGFAGPPDASFRRARGEGPNHVEQRGQQIQIGRSVSDE